MKWHFVLLTVCCMAASWPMPEDQNNGESDLASDTETDKQTTNLRGKAELVPPYLSQFQEEQEKETEVEAVVEVTNENTISNLEYKVTPIITSTSDQEYSITLLGGAEIATDESSNKTEILKEVFDTITAPTETPEATVLTETVTVPTESADTKHSAYQSINGGSCIHECVPYYLCHNGEIITDGVGIIDIRLGNTGDSTSQSAAPVGGNCPGFLEVCCRDPSQEIIIPVKEIPVYEPSCGKHNADGVVSRISGFSENEAQFAEFPWMAIILTTEDNGENEVNIFKCGGSLIEPDVVLTAAHCVAGKDPSSLKVRLGEWDTRQTTELYEHQDIYVRALVYHERFNGHNLRNDVALLFLAVEAQLDYHVDTICLPQEAQNFTASSCLATGWGKDSFGDEGRYQNVLKKVPLPLVEAEECEVALQTTRLSQFFQLHHSFTCAGGVAGQDTCKGDGGGPLVCSQPGNPGHYVQVGITAWGISCGEDGIPGVYVDVRKFTHWIKEQVQVYRQVSTTPKVLDCTETHCKQNSTVPPK